MNALRKVGLSYVYSDENNVSPSKVSVVSRHEIHDCLKP